MSLSSSTPRCVPLVLCFHNKRLEPFIWPQPNDPTTSIMVLWGFADGSRIARPLMLQVKVALKEWPEMYWMIAHLIFGQCIFTYSMIKEMKDRNWTARYKKRYTIFRPNDPRTLFYPKPFVTESHLLPKDHPMTPRDIPFFHAPPIEVHRFDPKVRGKSQDGKEHVTSLAPQDMTYIPGLWERDEWKKEEAEELKQRLAAAEAAKAAGK